VIGDLVGFAAALLRRGVRFVQIPTKRGTLGARAAPIDMRQRTLFLLLR
jgi:hypothetical protein